MKEDNKYYVPLLKEINTAIDIEWRPEHWKTKELFDWDKFSIEVEVDDYPDLDQLTYINYLIKENRIRVKFLDRADIESFGFVKGAGPWWNHTNGIQLAYGEGIDPNHAMIARGLTHGVPNYIFQGTVKNKSKLADVLEMIGI